MVLFDPLNLPKYSRKITYYSRVPSFEGFSFSISSAIIIIFLVFGEFVSIANILKKKKN